MFKQSLLLSGLLLTIAGCNSTAIKPKQVDVLLSSSQVYTGETVKPQALDIAICGQTICGVSPQGSVRYQATTRLDLGDKIISPGFIDPHTHSLAELYSNEHNANLNYLYQGVTTVINGNDGESPLDLALAKKELTAQGMGTNTAFFIGHNTVREAVMGRVERHANEAEISQMKQLVKTAMQNGALGLSSGLYYVPGNYANTHEVIELAKVAAQYNGIYESHIRDESTFNIGFLNALDEAIEIGKKAKLPVHIAHIKALGVDVWGQAKPAVAKIEQAQQNGITITADQYPWLASGTMLHNAVVPKWVMADGEQARNKRLQNPKLLPKIKTEIKENIRRRGGGERLLVTVTEQHGLVGNTLADIAKQRGISEVDAVIALVQGPQVRVASFNMHSDDVNHFMQQYWVVTSSDGTDGHPRKYASFPEKFATYVMAQKRLTKGEFVQQSATKTAALLGLSDRGKLSNGLKADIIVFDANEFKPEADFANWDVFSSGIEHVFVNGKQVIKQGVYTGVLPGKVLSRN